MTNQQPNLNHSSVENYNPFNSSNLASPIVDKRSLNQSVEQAIGEPSNMPGEDLPTYSPSGAQKQMSDELKKRQEDLENKANELLARESQLASTPVAGNNKNWPPLPARCCFGPCFYQDISVEVPDTYQRTVRIMYYMWILYALLLLLNMLGALALFIANGEGYTFGFSILIFFLFSPLSFVCWFRPVYNAFRSDSSFNFMVFFFVFFIQFIISVFYAVGIPRMGSCGLLNGITTLTEKSHTISTYTVGIIAIVIGMCWAVHAMVSFYMLVKIHRMYRGTTASFAKAQEELASGVMKNQHVQNAAATAVSQASNQSFNSAASELRY